MSKHRVLPDVDLVAEDVRDSKGRRITEGYAKRAAADAVTFRVTPQLRERADAEAAKQGRRVSDLAREALERYLAS